MLEWQPGAKLVQDRRPNSALRPAEAHSGQMADLDIEFEAFGGYVLSFFAWRALYHKPLRFRGPMRATTVPSEAPAPGSGRVLSVSLFILFVVVVQSCISLVLPPIQMHEVRQTWPFLNYPMYRESFGEGDLMSERSIIAVMANGDERRLAPEDLELSIWHYAMFASAVGGRDARVVEEFLARSRFGADGNPVVSLRVMLGGHQLSNNGLVKVPEKEVGRMDLVAPGGTPLRESGAGTGGRRGSWLSSAHGRSGQASSCRS